MAPPMPLQRAQAMQEAGTADNVYTARATPSSSSTSKGSVQNLSRSTTPGRPATARAPTGSVASSKPADSAETPRAQDAAKQSYTRECCQLRPCVQALLALIIACCMLDVLCVLPHPGQHSSSLGDDQFGFAVLGYPCQGGRVSAETAQLLEMQQRLLESQGKLQAVVDRKGAAIDKEDFMLAKEIELEEDELKDELQTPAADFSKLLKTAKSSAKEYCYDPPPASTGLASEAVRAFYTQHLQLMSQRLLAYQNLASEQLSQTSPMQAGLSAPMPLVLEEVKDTCALAGLAVRMRARIKMEARLRGSSLMHAFLDFRDCLKYGFFVNFSLQDMLDRKKAKMVRAGKTPTGEEVCSAVLASSFTANAGVTQLAKDLGEAGISYELETAALYGALVVTVLALALVGNCCRSMISKKKST
eukprot:TRINITY_DN112878_c0_g1_i1.p1 TRINITY_DN112878_c0_g1~~TRINITY_DN112878_c0_g1_i1.p1  ORF type:complete len:437 (+),score=111.09 TRINITY_DN112878_c0_g1_i1:63-1313(+)